MPDGPGDGEASEADLDDIALVIAYCTASKARLPDLCWEDAERTLAEGWIAVRGDRATRWEAVSEMCRAHWDRRRNG